MKKSLLLILSIISITIEISAQNADFNQQKYWYLRWRLKNYFMVVGSDYGQSIPIGIRNTYIDNILFSKGINVGDAPNYLATYIGVLATEYHLLNNNNEDVSETVRELYYALNAINRLDNCEAQYPWNQSQNKLDGMCSRGDVPINFVQTHYNELNKNLNSFNPNTNPGDPTEIVLGSQYNLDTINDKERGMFSQDHISSIFMGLAFVTKYIPANVTYNGMNLRQEAQDICFRIWTYMHTSNWRLKNPEGQTILEEWGSQAWVFQYGFTRAAMYIDPNPNHLVIYSSALTNMNHSLWDLASSIGTGWCPFLSNLGINSCDQTGNTWIVCKLAAVGNSWVGVTACGLPFANCTGQKIYTYSYTYFWDAYYPLIHGLLHGDYTYVSNSAIENDLNSMPCSGHWAHGDPQKGLSVGWATSHKYQSHPNENQNGDGGSFQGEYTGLEYMLLFNMYSIYRGGNFITNYKRGDELQVGGNLPYLTFLVNNPTAIGATSGTADSYNTIPAFNRASKTITSTTAVETKNLSGTYTYYSGFPPQQNTVTITIVSNTDGNLTFKAGESIKLLPGFKVKGGSYFHGYISPVLCNNTGTAYQRQSNNSNNEVYSSGAEIPLTKVEEPEVLINEFKIYPNPNSGMFNVNYASSNSSGNVSLFIYNYSGQQIFYENLSSGLGKYQSSIDIGSFSKGVYLLKLIDGEQVKNAKIVVQ